MTLEAESVDVPHDKGHDAWVVGDAPCVVLDWFRSAGDVELAG